ncbi:Flp family type IVb pilin [Zhihengliuella halotolerans]|uniref:Pilus assembly protein Flp/PilA n=1 Tax=Zhihengliuella halotolerans TaxID=370736 RepID=A0A4Q8AB62_9MICC|nr:Flp family type IVb pilin [Zhihengliuella halotolerans]RZU60805.1 pilus assembly protein Flp/PilA [Zhihengliuella halotolerans]
MNTFFANIYLALETLGGRLRREEKGATAVEYGLTIGLISLVVLIGAAAMTGALNNLWTEIGAYLQGIADGL